MKRALVPTLFVAGLLIVPVLAIAPSLDAAAPPSPRAGRLLVGVNSSVVGPDYWSPLLGELAPGRGLLTGSIRAVNPAAGFLVLEVPDVSAFLRLAASDARFRYVVEDVPTALRPHYTPNDARYTEQYALALVDAARAWDRTRGSDSLVLAIVDSGIETSHPDLGRFLPGRDFTGQNSLRDTCGHGTHVAGIAGATLDNGKGVAGLAQVRIIPVKVLAYNRYSGCTGSFSAIANGITWAADQGARVISMSLGCEGCENQAIVDAIRYATNTKGAIVVASAGNSGPCTDCVNFPATMPEVIAVGCTNADDDPCSFTSTGPEVDIAAPGEGILSTWPGGGYKSLSGTSMSTPLVSAAAMLLLSADPRLTPSEVRALLLDHADDVAASGVDVHTGRGRLDVGAAVASLGGAPAGPANAAPLARYSASLDGLTVHVDGTASADPDGSITAWRWDWGDGTPTGSGATATHTYAAAGSYRLVLTVTDNASATGNTAQSVTVSVSGAILSESFDDGVADGWTLTGLWRIGGDCLGAASAPNALQYNRADTCKYATGSRTAGGAEVSVDLTGKANPVLSFRYKSAVERYSGGSYDTMRVIVSTDGGASWTSLWLRDCRNPDAAEWTEVRLDLSGYRTEATLIRFQFDSRDGNYNGFAGWAVDDVLIA